MTVASTTPVQHPSGIIARDIQHQLERAGYSAPAVANSAEDAIRQVQETRPDIVLMDIRLKGEKDGIAAADIVKTKFNVPVIFLTSFADAETLQRAKCANPFGYVLKPLT